MGRVPVFAPALMPAADSGDIRIGGPEKYPLSNDEDDYLHKFRSLIFKLLIHLHYLTLCNLINIQNTKQLRSHRDLNGLDSMS